LRATLPIFNDGAFFFIPAVIPAKAGIQSSCLATMFSMTSDRAPGRSAAPLTAASAYGGIGIKLAWRWATGFRPSPKRWL